MMHGLAGPLLLIAVGLALAAGLPDEGKQAMRGDEGHQAVAPPPDLSRADINRLKLYEIRREGDPERVEAEFARVGRDRVYDLVADRARSGAFGMFHPNLVRRLRNGSASERVQAVLQLTDMEYAGAIEIESDPRVFETFQRDVLRHVTTRCGGPGCHGGGDAYVFSLPRGSYTTKSFAYTTFYVLDAIHTPAGAMIDRATPENSLLLRYLTEPARGERKRGNAAGSEAVRGAAGHPPVEGRSVRPAFRGPSDRDYQKILAWIASLRDPHPGYELAYVKPAWLEGLSRAVVEAETQMSETQPASP